MTESTEQRQVLEMLSEGKINTDEADKLLSKLKASASEEESQSASDSGKPKNEAKKPKFLRISCRDEKGAEDINIRLPLGLLKGGARLAALLPGSVLKKMNQQSVGIGVVNLSGDELLDSLCDLDIDVQGEGESVRICCE